MSCSLQLNDSLGQSESLQHAGQSDPLWTQLIERCTSEAQIHPHHLQAPVSFLLYLQQLVQELSGCYDGHLIILNLGDWLQSGQWSAL